MSRLYILKEFKTKFMRKFILSLIALIFAVQFYYISAQILTLDNLESGIQRARIGLVDEFMKRFNGDEIHPDISPSDSDSINRNLIGLFDIDQLISQDKKTQDSIQDEVLNLIRTITNNSIRINYSDSTWLAIAHCKGLVMGNQENFDIFMTVQSRGDDMYKWVINAVDGECFNVNPRNTNENLIISPDAHETKFIALQRILKEQPYNIQLYISKNAIYDPTSVFTYLVYSGKLKLEYVERLEFIFFQVPNYAFHIQYFDRTSNNSGWLISNFYRFSDSDKSAFMKWINLDNSKVNISYELSGTEELIDLPCDSVMVNDSDANSISTIPANRVIERLNSLIDYIKFISDDSNDQPSKNFYAQKMIKLFSPEAKVITKDYRTGKTNALNIKNFIEVLTHQKFMNVTVEGVTSVISQKTNLGSGEADILGTDIIPLSIIKSDNALNILNNITLPYHLENTEDGVEYIYDFGDLYISLNRPLSKTEACATDIETSSRLDL